MLEHHEYRAVGEFEPQESVLITWPSTKYVYPGFDWETTAVEIVKELRKVVKVYVQVDFRSPEEIAGILTAAGVPLDNIEFVKFTSDFIDMPKDQQEAYEMNYEVSYFRDYGAEVVMDDEGRRANVEFDQAWFMLDGANRYDRAAAIQTAAQRWHAELVGIDKHFPSMFTSEGGDREFNGDGVFMGVKSTECDKRNPQFTQEEVEREYSRLFNVKKFVWLPNGSYEDEDYALGAIPGPDGEFNAYRSQTANGHVDEIARFVSTDTILLAEVTEEEAAHDNLAALNKERLDAAYEVIKAATDVHDKPFNIIRIPVPEPIYVDFDMDVDSVVGTAWADVRDRETLFDGTPAPKGVVKFLPALSYANFLITNNLVVAQKYWSEGMPESIREKDEEARRVLESCFPDRRVVQINTLALNLNGGGIHCFTRHVPASRKRA